MTPTGTPRTPSSSDGLGPFLASLRRRRKLVVCVALAICAVAVVASTLHEREFRSEAKVLVKPVSIFPNGTTDGGVVPNMATEEELVQSPRVVDIVRRRIGPSVTAMELVQELDVSVARQADARILIMTYSHPDPVVARERAQAFADAYIAFRRKEALADERSQSIALRAEVALLERRSGILSKQADLTHDPVLRKYLRKQAELLERLSLDKRITLSLPSPDPDIGSVVQVASRPSATFPSSRIAVGAVGLLIGLVAGVTVAAIGTMDDRPASPGELGSLVGASVVVSVPKARVRRTRMRPRLITRSAPGSAAADAYRILRTVVVPRLLDGPAVLLVTSADTGEGKSTVAANLAVSLAEGDFEVVLVDCNPRRPKIHDLFQVDGTPGLVHVVAGTADLGATLRPSGTDHLKILTAGRRSHRSAEVLASRRMATVVAGLSSMADFVILDGPAVSGAPDALALVLVSNAVVFVADALITDTSAVVEARHRLMGVGADLPIAIFNNSPEAGGHVGDRVDTLAGAGVAAYGA